jgi:uncharacterized protein (DUF2235 family)
MMAKNILVFSDGTGQAGGLIPDEKRSNIYKMFRAMRCGPDTAIDPADQLAFYDAGLGSLADGSIIKIGWMRRIYNLVSQATGFGITRNIIDCYAAIITMWQPGDRIFLFGFSRGAYTVRCLGAVLCLCGVPTQMKGGGILRRDPASVKRIAREAVVRVYQHVSSPKDSAYREQRARLADRFRRDYGCFGPEGQKNGYPYFIGVFDTVAALGSYPAIALLIGGYTVAATVLSFALCWTLRFFAPGAEISFLSVLGAVGAASAITAGAAYLFTHIKYATGLEDHSFLSTLHLAAPKQKFYDQQLDDNVKYARHALSIDENRADFARVQWGDPKSTRPARDENGMTTFEQIWFAGNHSDVGGSYPENESRLSDITLKWMTDTATKVVSGIKFDPSLLRAYPSAAGPQHDECRGSWTSRFWKQAPRKLVPNATIHPSVEDRLQLDAVLHYDIMQPYRPEPLRNQAAFAKYYNEPSK